MTWAWGSGALFIFSKLNACIAFSPLSYSLIRRPFPHHHPARLSLLSNIFKPILKFHFLEELPVLLRRLCGLKASLLTTVSLISSLRQTWFTVLPTLREPSSWRPVPETPTSAKLQPPPRWSDFRLLQASKS